MIRVFLAAVFLPLLAVAQLRLYVAPPNSETLLPAIYDLGTVAAGDSLDIRFRVRNQGAAAVTITSMSVAGTGFTMTGQPSLPHIVAPGMNVDFTIRFQARDYGTYSANLAVNGVSALLRATGLPAPVIKAADTTLAAGASIDFGRVERGSTAKIAFQLTNTTAVPLNVRAVDVSGMSFRAAALTSLPSEIGPGQALPFDVWFEPKSAGVFTGTLTVDGRTFRLTGTATEPPFARPAVMLDTTPSGSAQQAKIAVRFPAPSRTSGTGSLRIEFRPSAPAADNDAAIQFLSGGRRATFTVTEGDSAARFGSAFEAVYQTGTTAGTIVFTAEVGGYTEQTTLTIAPAPPKLDKTTASRNGNSLELQLSGYDNAHSTAHMVFTFFDSSGQPVQPGAMRSDVAADFKRYYDASALGGAFALKATFPVAGNAALITAVDIEIANSAGATRTERIRF